MSSTPVVGAPASSPSGPGPSGGGRPRGQPIAGSAFPVNALKYVDIAAAGVDAQARADRTLHDAETEEQLSILTVQARDELVAKARSEGAALRDGQLRQEFQRLFEQEAAKIANAVSGFQRERLDYFGRVEGEVVKLALAIAAKILHREAQVDPMLLAALVRVAVNQLHDGSKVSIRIHPGEAAQWRAYFQNSLNGTTVDVIEDAHLSAKDCILETDLGSANFNIGGQLKEVEQGFFDLLALRPQK